MAIFQKHTAQKIPASINEMWNFISSPQNLKRITPDYMGFEIQSKELAKKMYPGMMIRYTVKPLFNIPMTWLTEITQVKEKEFFVDDQRVGPYKIWHHEHRITPIEGGVLMNDIITYQPPLGFLGSLANTLVIKHKLNEIFDYREKALIEIFGTF